MSGCIATKAMCTQFVPKFSHLLARVRALLRLNRSVQQYPRGMAHGSVSQTLHCWLFHRIKHNSLDQTAGHPLILLPVPHNWLILKQGKQIAVISPLLRLMYPNLSVNNWLLKENHYIFVKMSFFNQGINSVIFFSLIFGCIYSEVFKHLVLIFAFVVLGRHLSFLTVTNTNSMKGKTVLITGASAGLGEYFPGVPTSFI